MKVYLPDLGLTQVNRERVMIKTIIVSSCVSVQGTFVQSLPNGLIIVRDGKTDYYGKPVTP